MKLRTVSVPVFLFLLLSADGLFAQRIRKPQTPKPPSTSGVNTATVKKAGSAVEKNSSTQRSARMSAEQQKNVDKLASDLQAIHAGSTVTQAQKDALATSLTALAEGSNPPDPNLVQSLAKDLSSAVSDGQMSGKEKIALANDLEAVMNSANVSKQEIDQAISDTETVLSASGIDASDVDRIVADLQAIAKQAQGNRINNSTVKRPGGGVRR